MLVFLLLTLNIFHTFLYCFYCQLWANKYRLAMIMTFREFYRQFVKIQEFTVVPETFQVLFCLQILILFLQVLEIIYFNGLLSRVIWKDEREVSCVESNILWFISCLDYLVIIDLWSLIIVCHWSYDYRPLVIGQRRI